MQDQYLILTKVKEHQNMAAYHNKEATRLIESLEGVSAPSTRKGGLSDEVKAKLLAKNRRNKPK